MLKSVNSYSSSEFPDIVWWSVTFWPYFGVLKKAHYSTYRFNNEVGNWICHKKMIRDNGQLQDKINQHRLYVMLQLKKGMR